MPRASISPSAARDPKRLTSILNDFQRQISACRVRIKVLEERINRKPGRPKTKKAKPKQPIKPTETNPKEPDNANGTDDKASNSRPTA